MCRGRSLVCFALLGAQAPAPEAAPQAPVVATAPGPIILQPGALPADATPEARAAWDALLTAMQPKPESAAVITAFDLAIQTRVTTVGEGGGSQSNMVDLRYRYLHPGCISTTMADSKVERMRGPDGDWLWDPKKGDLVELAGKDFAQDRRELTQTLSIARNYLALAEPARLRIARLELLKSPPQGLPTFDATIPPPKGSALARAGELKWVSITSPDFQLVEAVRSEAARLFTAQIGLDPTTHRPLLAMIHQDEGGTRVLETAVLVDLAADQFKEIDGRLVPTFFRVHDPLLPSSPFTFQSKARVEVAIRPDSTLRAKWTVEDFRPKRL